MASSSSTAAPSGLSSNAEFLFTAVFKVQPSYEVARRYFAVLRQWAGTGKAYKGRTFSRAEVEEAIIAFERSIATDGARGTPGAAAAAALLAGASAAEAARKGGGEAAKSASTSDSKQPKTMNHFWPRWALDASRGVEVLPPTGTTAKWTPARPVGIGYRGQKKHFLFVRAVGFEMDCRRAQVRAPGGGPNVQELQEALLKAGGDPSSHPDWTDGTDTLKGSSSKAVDFVAPGVALEGQKVEDPGAPKLIGDGGVASEMFGELSGDFERMALLQRSRLVKIRTTDHPDPLTEPRACASIQLPPLTEEDVLMMRPDQAEKNLSSLQVETVTLAARRFRRSLPDGRRCGYVIGDGTGCGKGRCIAALAMHMWNSGVKRHIWVSATNDLYYDACRDLKDLGANIPCITLRRLPPSAPLDRWGTETNKEMFKHLGAEGDGIIFVTYSLLVQTGQRRQLIPIPIRTEEARALFLVEGRLTEQLKVTETIRGLTDVSGMPTELQRGDHVASVQSVRQLKTMTLPFTLTIQRVLHTEKKGAKTKDAFDAVDGKAIGLEITKDDIAKDKKRKFEVSEDLGKNKDAEGSHKPDDSDLQDLTAWNSRLGQLVEWMGGKGAQGLICFDEVHKAKNLVPDKDDTASTKTGLFVDLLQRSCPQAPILYVSATAATEVKHLGYMGRLGLWGAGTAFEDFQDFAKAMESGGVSAMEMLAINMKALGAMSCKALAYVGTEFEVVEVGLAQEQRDSYNNACAFWQGIIEDYKKLTQCEELFKSYVKRFFGKKLKEGMDVMAVQKRLWQFFWGAQQRFFKAMCNAAKVPAAAEYTREAVEAGEQVCLSIWATGEARSKQRMENIKDETPGRITIDEFSEGSLLKVSLNDEATRKRVVAQLQRAMRLRQDLTIGRTRVRRTSQLLEVHGRKISKPEDLEGATLPAILMFRCSSNRWLDVKATLTETGEKVRFEMRDDELGERVVVAKVHEGPTSFRRAATEQWHIKLIGNRPVGKINTTRLATRLRKGHAVAFHDPIVSEHLSGPEMILEHFIKTIFLTQDENGNDIGWACDLKQQRLEEMKQLNLPPNAMDELVDLLGGPRKVAEMSGRSHRMKRKKDGSLAYVARSEELRCSNDGVNLVEQEFFQKGIKKACILTEVAAAGISLHSDRRQVRKDFQPPRRLMISVELPWGADKAIQSFGRVHRANQLQPPRFKILVTPIAGEVRFTSAIARRMKLLGAVTKGDRMTSMGGGADRHMAEFDVNNVYGIRALLTLYADTTKITSADPDLLTVYEAMPFLGSDLPATGRWADWETFAHEASNVWRRIRMYEDMEEMKGEEIQRGSTKESGTLNRFFNRILMLDIDLQNAIFAVFFAIYAELVRVDKSNGEFDEGVENLNDFHGRKHDVEIEQTEILYKDPRSGAETCYHVLSLDRGTSWEAAKEMFDKLDANSQEGFYCYRPSPSDPPQYFLAKERQQVGGAGGSAATWQGRRKKRQYVIWKPDFHEGSRQIALESHLAVAGCERIEGPKEMQAVEADWKKSHEESKDERLIRMHVLTGDVLTVWRLAKKGDKVDQAAAADGDGADGEGGDGVKAVVDISYRPGGTTGVDASMEGEEVEQVAVGDGNMDIEHREVNKDDKPLETAALQKELQIVRAITKPDGIPIVGLKVFEADLPKLRYVLSCQQMAVKEAAENKPQKSLRDLTMEVATVLSKRLREAPDRKLPWCTWFEVHKALAAESIVPYSATGMRGTQIAVERLARAKVVKVEADGMAAEVDVEEEDELEQLVFPEEFTHEEEEPAFDGKKKRKGGNGILDEWEEALFDDAEDDDEDDLDDDLDDGNANDDAQASASTGKVAPLRALRLSQEKRKSRFARSSHKAKEAASGKKDKKDKKRKKDKNETKEEKRERKKMKRMAKLQNMDAKEDGEDDPATFEDLFGTASHASASDPEQKDPGPSTTARPPATPAKAPTAPGLERQLREEVGRVLEGLDLQSTTLGQVRAKIEVNLSLQPGELDEHKEFIGNILKERIQHMQEGSPKEERMQKRARQEESSKEAKKESLQDVSSKKTEDYQSWSLEELQECLDNLGMDSDGDKATLVGRLQGESGLMASAAPEVPAAADVEMAPTATPAAEEAPVKQAPASTPPSPKGPKESETGMIWTYEVTGKKIGIREGSSIDSNPQGDYLENGELFNVTERVRGGGDVRVYLKLADGRGWAYDRSAKDEGKVVVEELGSKPA